MLRINAWALRSANALSPSDVAAKPLSLVFIVVVGWALPGQAE